MKTRKQIVGEMRRIRNELRQIFTDCAHWNEHVRKAHEAVINPDEDGWMARTESSLTAALNAEDAKDGRAPWQRSIPDAPGQWPGDWTQVTSPAMRGGAMKALTLYPVWAMLIALEKKRFETRSWSTHFRGALAITSSARLTNLDILCFRQSEYREVFAAAGITNVRQIPLGAVLCTAMLTDVLPTEDVRDTITQQERDFGYYDDGRFAWKLEGVERLAVPLPCKGRQQLWDIDLPALRAAMLSKEPALL